MKFTTLTQAKEFFVENVLPTLILDEDESLDAKFQDYLESEEVEVQELIDTNQSLYYDLNNHHEN